MTLIQRSVPLHGKQIDSFTRNCRNLILSKWYQNLSRKTRLCKVRVASGDTLRVTLDSSATQGVNEVYIRYVDIPTGYAFDAAYTNPSRADQEVLIPSTQAGVGTCTSEQ